MTPAGMHEIEARHFCHLCINIQYLCTLRLSLFQITCAAKKYCILQEHVAVKFCTNNFQ